MPYAKGISEKFILIGNRYDIRAVFKTKHALRGSFMITRLEGKVQIMTHFVCSIFCVCGEENFRGTGRPLVTWLRELSHNIKQRLRETIKAVRHSDGGHRINCNSSRVLQL